MTLFRSLTNWMKERSSLLGEETLGFIPTMGALHEGHLSLVRLSKQNNTKTLVSLFINPTQFDKPQDLKSYPKNFDRDLELLESEGVDYVLLPEYTDLYPDSYKYKVSESDFSQKLCGAHRPGHFDGVLSIMLKLLNIAQAHNCYMGEKDHQQLTLVKGMTKAFFMKTQVISGPTIREASGLAMSSRNERLSPEARTKASQIYKTLKEKKSSEDCLTELTHLGFDVDYVEDHNGRRYAAASIEGVRLIDNISLETITNKNPIESCKRGLI